MEKITYKKTELLKAMKKVLSEYKKNDHIANVDHCSLCMLYNKCEDNDHTGHQCKFCPMYVFQKDYTDWFPCMRRRCSPIDCEGEMTEDLNELKAVIDFYEEAIGIVKSMSAEQLNEPKAFMFLIKIDKLVAKKYCLV
jgi:hypothetical protein